MPPPSYICPLNNVGKKEAERRGELESDMLDAVQALRNWVLEQSEWLCSPTDTQFLLGFLRNRKYSQKSAKERLVTFWKIRTQFSNFSLNIDTSREDLQRILKQGMVVPMPTLDKDGCLVFLGRIGTVDAKTLAQLIQCQNQLSIAVADELLRSDMVQVCGFKILHDFTGVTMDHLMKVESVMRDIKPLFMKAYPIRLRAACYYNAGPVFDLLMALIKRFFPPKMRDRVTTHASLRTVYDIIDKSVLPVEYLPDDYSGPNAGNVQQVVDDHAEYMKNPEVRNYVYTLSDKKHFCNPDKMPYNVIPTESFRSLNV